MTEHIKNRNKLKEINRIDTFNALLDLCTLSDTDKEILRLHYLQEKDFQYIGDALGFSESSIKARHKKAIKKLSTLM